MIKSQFTFNWPLIGNQHIVSYLEKCLVSDNVSGAYIFAGPDDVGKTTLAVHFAQALLCDNYRSGAGVLPCDACPSCRRFTIASNKQTSANELVQPEIAPAHGDFHLIIKEPDKKNISIDQVREFIKTLNLSSFLDSYKIGVIKQAEWLSLEAANALLKTLEEPKAKVMIILVMKNVELLPATIASRSKILHFHPVPAGLIYDYLVKECGASRSTAKNLARLSLGRPALAVKFLEDKAFFEFYQEILNLFINFSKQDALEKFKAIEKFIKTNANNLATMKTQEKVLDVWGGIIRDALLLEYGQEHLIQHHFAIAVIANFKNLFKISDLLNLDKNIKIAKKYLLANVNFRLVLENIALFI